MFDQKELIQATFVDNASDFEVIYPIKVQNEEMTFAVLGPAGDFRGVSVTSMKRIALIKTQTLYLEEFVKQLDGKLIEKQIETAITGIENFTREGFLKDLMGKKRIAALSCGDLGDLPGRIISVERNMVEIDEYHAEYDRRLAKTFVHKDGVEMITVEAPWLRTIARAVKDKIEKTSY